MSAENMHAEEDSGGSRLRRFLWDGVLPEALGLCFVAIIFAGFTAAFLVADRATRKDAVRTAQAEADTLARVLAQSVAVATTDDAENVLAGLRHLPQFHTVQWTDADGSVRFAWPPAIVTVPSSIATPRNDDPLTKPVRATAPVRDPTGTNRGMLHVEFSPTHYAGRQSDLLWTWGIAAVVTLLVFMVAYYRLRRHLRPVAAIQRSLHTYAHGIERDLMTLTLSDSLGVIAQDWNRLVGELAQLQRRLDSAGATQTQDVLARFESAVFRRIVDRLPLGVLCIDADSIVTYANQNAATLLLQPHDDLQGATLGNAISEPAIAQALIGAQQRGNPLPIDHTRKDGEQELTLRFRVVRLSDQSGGEIVVTVEDISYVKEGERARDNFLYHVTHELRTPLTNIHAYAETLTKPDFDDEVTRKECYNVIISETRRLSRLVEDILSISQIEAGSARLSAGDVDLLRLLRQTVQDNLGGADEKGIDLTLAVPPKVPKIKGDKQRLSVLLNNLIGNAIKYTPKNGKVHVQLEVDNGLIRVAVTDTGIGISPEDQEHVFEKFYRAADDAVQTITGTGLGLALAQEVAHLHGGEITLRSEVGQGSTFTVELPQSASEPVEVTES